MNNRLALRIAVFGGLALVLFGVLFFRLWTLQVLNGEEYLAEANNNRTREVRVTAPRGEIVDREGEVLVDNRTSLALQINPNELPPPGPVRTQELRELADLANTTLPRVRRTIREELAVSPGAPVTLRGDVGTYLVYYLQENQRRFPGIEVRRVFVRDYPHGSLGAHIFGSVGEVDAEDLEEPRYRALEPGDMVGKEGLEATYDSLLRGRPGAQVIQVDSSGQPTGGELRSVEPAPGENLRLTIDADVQEAGEAALQGTGLPGAYVAMDVKSGEVLAMGSSPTFDPEELTRPLTQRQVNDLYNDESAPLTNRAIAGAYPTGSTFKAITSIAALASGAVTTTEEIYDDGLFQLGGVEFRNAGDAVFGSLAMERALEVSSDVYYYTLGDRMYPGNALQTWARKLGIGHPTGIDLPGETAGLLPTKAWREQLRREGLALEDRPWSAGDNVNLSVGQGDLQSDPIQMAVAYATIATGGVVPRPHLALAVEDAAGRIKHEVESEPRRRVQIDPEWRETILAGLHDAAQAPSGTSYGIFGGFPVAVAGKTGTAERPPNEDQSWYVVLAPYPNPEIVVAVTFENGGFGADTAAPAAKTILESYFGVEAGEVPETEGEPVSE